jgi:hypothetical protein
MDPNLARSGGDGSLEFANDGLAMGLLNASAVLN